MTLLKTLKLNGMAAAWDDVLSQDKQRKGSFEEVRGALAQAELSHRKAQSIHYQMKLATFPVYRNLAAFDFKASPLSEKGVCHLHQVSSSTTHATSSWLAAPARPILPSPSPLMPSDKDTKSGTLMSSIRSTSWSRNNGLGIPDASQND